MVAGGELLALDEVATGAISRRDDGGDGGAVVEVGVGFGRFGLVAFDAGDALLGMGRALPVLDDARVGLNVAVDTAFRARRHRHVCLPEARFLSFAGGLHPLHQDEREQEETAEGGDDETFGFKCHCRATSMLDDGFPEGQGDDGEDAGDADPDAGF